MHTIKYEKEDGQYIGKGDFLPLNKNDTAGTLFESQVNRTPDAIAIKFDNICLTYEELNIRVNKMANYLTFSGLMPKTFVALYLNSGIEMIVSILAVLKAGCCYVPLDVHYPSERIGFMIKDSNSKFILTENSLQHKISNYTGHLINMDIIEPEINTQSCIFHSKAKSNDLAYMIYTSGSTGVPKGVQISHLALNNHMTWMHHQFQFDSSDKVLLKTPLSFDPSVWEIFIPLFTGGELIVAPAGAHIDPDLLIDLVCENDVTTLQLVPSILKQFLNCKRVNKCHSLKKIYAGGESLRPEIKELFFKKLNCRLINLYGPTEATIDITFHEVFSSNSEVQINNIGKPIANTSIYLVNEQGNLAKMGEEGEIYIGSISLSHGYYNRDTLTKENFIENPFEPKQYKTIYKTGDLARWLATGDLEYIGRNNDQVKINGVRIEPKELVLTILQHKEVADCIILKKIDTHGHDYLACYLTHKFRVKLNISEIKDHLKARFPAFMLPKVYILINKIPLTVNGKVDVHALPEPDFKRTIKIDISEGELLEYEKKLLLIWQQVLEINQISIHDNFFEDGGSSLLALKLLSLIHEKLNVSLRIRDIFEYPTIKLQAQHIKKLQKRNNKTDTANSTNLPNPLIPLQMEGLKTPIFFIHPIGGTVFWFTHLAKLIGTNRPIYGIQDPSVDLENPVLDSIEEMASFYLSHIKKVQPCGPYLIGGASFGATVAVEISRQLKKNNEQILAILVLDGWGVYPNTLIDDNYFRNTMLRQHEELKVDFEKYGLPAPEILFDIQWYRLQLLWKYQMGLIEDPLVLFKSEEIMPAFAEIDAPFNHWENFTSKEITTFIVPGNHETMFREPHVYTLGDTLINYLLTHNL